MQKAFSRHFFSHRLMHSSTPLLPESRDAAHTHTLLLFCRGEKDSIQREITSQHQKVSINKRFTTIWKTIDRLGYARVTTGDIKKKLQSTALELIKLK